MSKITSEVGRVKTFKLVDKEGWLANWRYNAKSLHCFEEGVATLREYGSGTNNWFPVKEDSWKGNSVIQ
ncbi:MAG: hypothetical protein GY823_12090, partial [Flavobacteriaceae bacterium]|nr:hypothetical protein [Flavobacteriaceae bacterium]